MKQVIMFTMKTCPYCKMAERWIDELFAKNPQYKNVPFTVIDEEEQREVADSYDYYYVPTFYLDGVKVHEGVPKESIIKDIFIKAACQEFAESI